MHLPPNQPPAPPAPRSLPHQRFWRWFRQLSRPAKIVGCSALIFSCVICTGISAIAGAGNQATPVAIATASPADTPTIAPTAAQTAANTVATPTTPIPTLPPLHTATSTPQSTHYPPTTEADLRSLAAQGDASAIHDFHSESVGAVGVCPEPKQEVTVDSSVTGQQLAEDLLAYFYTQQLDSPCGSLVLAYHHQSEANDVYTAGRINFDTTDASGASNFDPNASNLKHTLTLDIGGDYTNQEYVVTY